MKKLLYFFLCLFTIFLLAGCDNLFGNDDDDDEIDISSLAVGEYDEYDSDFLEQYFYLSNSSNSKSLTLDFYRSAGTTITEPESGTYSIVSSIENSGEVEVSYSEWDGGEAFDLYNAVSGNLTVSQDSMTVALSDVVFDKYIMNVNTLEILSYDANFVTDFSGSATAASWVLSDY